MLKKNYTKKGQSCRVTFKYPNKENHKTAALAGDFNDWNVKACPMKRLKDGSFSVTVSLKAGHSYRFRYVLDGFSWVNDHDADSYIANDHGSDDSLVTV
ncbi:MAG: isoamylase early set domain-containing protein [Thermodesulfobacteriota bacterium]|nr:isoamylase early set domain-containing protein [Thermodesulfobacteriota bacterium]